jgi:hypothetical protein
LRHLVPQVTFSFILCTKGVARWPSRAVRGATGRSDAIGGRRGDGPVGAQVLGERVDGEAAHGPVAAGSQHPEAVAAVGQEAAHGAAGRWRRRRPALRRCARCRRAPGCPSRGPRRTARRGRRPTAAATPIRSPAVTVIVFHLPSSADRSACRVARRSTPPAGVPSMAPVDPLGGSKLAVEVVLRQQLHLHRRPVGGRARRYRPGAGHRQCERGGGGPSESRHGAQRDRIRPDTGTA